MNLIIVLRKKMKSMSLSLKDVHENYDKFLKDPKSDLFLMIDYQILPLHLHLLAEKSPYFQNILLKDPKRERKIQIIETPLNSETVKKILSTFYGYTLEIKRDDSLNLILETISFFQIKPLYDVILADLKKNFADYDFFVIMKLAQKFDLQQILEICLQNLEAENYEQINYNLFEFLNCCPELFISVLNGYLNKNKHQKTKLQMEKYINQLVQHYESFNKVRLPTFDIISLKTGSSESNRSDSDWRKIQIFPIEEQLNEEEYEPYKSDKDLSTQPSPHAVNYINTFAEAGKNFESYLFESDKKTQEKKLRRNSYCK